VARLTEQQALGQELLVEGLEDVLLREELEDEHRAAEGGLGLRLRHALLAAQFAVDVSRQLLRDLSRLLVQEMLEAALQRRAENVRRGRRTARPASAQAVARSHRRVRRARPAASSLEGLLHDALHFLLKVEDVVDEAQVARLFVLGAGRAARRRRRRRRRLQLLHQPAADGLDIAQEGLAQRVAAADQC
jgi:hypothetical protein